MPGDYDGNGVVVGVDYVEIPSGQYLARIVSAEQGTTAKGDDKVTVGYEILKEGPYHLQPLKFHTVTFFKDKSAKGAGIALHFLKCIGEPFEGNFKWNEANWIGKRVLVTTSLELQTEGKYAGKKFARVKFVDPAPQGSISEEVPF